MYCSTRTYMEVLLYIADGWMVSGVSWKITFMPVAAVVRSRVGLTHCSCHPLVFFVFFFFAAAAWLAWLVLSFLIDLIGRMEIIDGGGGSKWYIWCVCQLVVHEVLNCYLINTCYNNSSLGIYCQSKCTYLSHFSVLFCSNMIPTAYRTVEWWWWSVSLYSRGCR